jgi:hypothetical protein
MASRTAAAELLTPRPHSDARVESLGAQAWADTVRSFAYNIASSAQSIAHTVSGVIENDRERTQRAATHRALARTVVQPRRVWPQERAADRANTVAVMDMHEARAPAHQRRAHHTPTTCRTADAALQDSTPSNETPPCQRREMRQTITSAKRMSSGRILSKKVTKWSLMRQRLVYLEWNGL